MKDTGKYEENHCDPCTTGYACDSVGLPDAVTQCSAGHYCTLGSNMTDPIGQTFGDLCPPGYYCPEGTGDYQHFPCANGTYSAYTGEYDYLHRSVVKTTKFQSQEGNERYM